MRDYALFILTKDNVYYLEDSDTYKEIIDFFDLQDDEDIVKITFEPPVLSKIDIKDFNNWDIIIDQDNYPDWTYEDDPLLEDRARKALSEKINIEKIGNVSVGTHEELVKVGYKGIAVTKDKGNSISGGRGVSISGFKGTSETGDYGAAHVDAYGTAIAGIDGFATSNIGGVSKVGYSGTAVAKFDGRAIAGDFGLALAEEYGTAIVGDKGQAIAGFHGKAKAGEDGVLIINYKDSNNRLRVAVGYVGEDGICPDIFYTVEDGKLVQD